MISVDEISEVVATQFDAADLNREGVPEAGRLCYWSSTGLGGSDQDPFSISVDRQAWRPPNNYTEGTSEEFMLDGNAAYQTDHGNICDAAVAVGQDVELAVQVFYLDERCEVARSLLDTAFSHLSR